MHRFSGDKILFDSLEPHPTRSRRRLYPQSRRRRASNSIRKYGLCTDGSSRDHSKASRYSRDQSSVINTSLESLRDFVDSCSSAYPMSNVSAAILISPTTILILASRSFDKISRMPYPRVHPTTQVISRKHVRFKIHPSVFHKSTRTPNHTSSPPYFANIRLPESYHPSAPRKQTTLRWIPFLCLMIIQSPPVVKAATS